MSEDEYLKLTNTIYKIIGFFPEEDPLKNKIKEKALEVMEGLLKQDDLKQVSKDIDVLKGYLVIGKAQGWIDNINFLILTKEYNEIKEKISTTDQVIQDMELIEKAESLPLINEYENKEIPFTSLEVNPVRDYKDKEKIQNKQISNGVNKSLNKYKENEPLTGFTENKEKIEKKASISQNPVSERQKKILGILKKQKKAQVGDLKKVFSQVSKRTLRRDLDGLLKSKMVVRTGEWNEVFYSLS